MLGEIEKGTDATQSLQFVYGHTYDDIEVSYSASFSANISNKSFGLSGGVSAKFEPVDKIETMMKDCEYSYFESDPIDGVYTIKNQSTGKPMEVLGNTTLLVTQGSEDFNAEDAAHRKNAEWQFKISPVSQGDEVLYTIKSIGHNNYISQVMPGGTTIRTASVGELFRIVANREDGDECFKIMPPYENYSTAIMAEDSDQKKIIITSLFDDFNTTDWLLIPVAEEDVGKAQSSSFDLKDNGVYKLKNVGTGKYIEIANYNANIDVLATPASYSYQKTCQEFRLILENGLFELAPNHLPYHRLDVQGGTDGSGIPIQQYFENDSDAQKFILQPEKTVSGNPRFRIYTVTSKLDCVLQCNSSNITQETDSDSNENQLWELVYQYSPEINLENEYSNFVFRNVMTGHFLEVSKGTIANGTAILQNDFVGDNKQRWQIEHVGNGLLTLKVRSNPAYVLDIDRSRNTNGAKVQLWAYEGNKNQKFKIVQRYRGEYAVYANTSNFTKCLSVKDGSGEAGEIVHQWAYTGTRELWTIWKASGLLSNSSTIKVLDIDNTGYKTTYYVPSETRRYTIETVGEDNAVITLRDENGAEIAILNDDAGVGNNEKDTFVLTKGKKYSITVSYLMDAESGPCGLMVYPA